MKLAAELQTIQQEFTCCGVVEVHENGGCVAPFSGMSWEVRGDGAVPSPSAPFLAQVFCTVTHQAGRMSSAANKVRTVLPTNFSVTIRQSGPISLLDVAGQLTSFETGALRDSVSRLLQQGRKDIVLNLSGLQYLDSSGIGELARIYVSVVKVGGQMKVVGLSHKVEEVLKITQLHQVFPEFPSEEAALESFPESSRKGII